MFDDLEPAPLGVPAPANPSANQPPAPASIAGTRAAILAGLKTMDIKGKAYIPVNERVRAFRELYPTWSLLNDILSSDAGVIVMCATIKDEQGRIIANAHASETIGDGQVNRTSALENCETSAIGRALGMLGIGIDTAIATADEVHHAQQRQQAATRPPYQPPAARPPAAAALPPPRDAQQEGMQLAAQAQRMALMKQISAAFKGLDNHAQQAVCDRAGKSTADMNMDELHDLHAMIQQVITDSIF